MKCIKTLGLLSLVVVSNFALASRSEYQTDVIFEMVEATLIGKAEQLAGTGGEGTASLAIHAIEETKDGSNREYKVSFRIQLFFRAMNILPTYAELKYDRYGQVIYPNYSDAILRAHSLQIPHSTCNAKVFIQDIGEGVCNYQLINFFCPMGYQFKNQQSKSGRDVFVFEGVKEHQVLKNFPKNVTYAQRGCKRNDDDASGDLNVEL